MAVSRIVAGAVTRRRIRRGQSEARITHMVGLAGRITLTLDQRVKLATELVKSRMIKNISKAVVKETGPMGGIIVTQRSIAGEFPRADTTHLMKTIFSDTRRTIRGYEGFIGTPLDYGLILELKMKRSFLVRTLEENRTTVYSILMGPIL